ncbi:MAG: glycerophosphodiester phosphodiesterase family protein [Gemmatimonadota bacterium]
MSDSLDGAAIGTTRFSDDLFGPGSPLRVIGHRGAAGVMPENTLPSFRHAVESGADAIELDLHCSRCGRLVVIHDDDVDRTTQGSGPVESMDLAAIRELDAGYRFQPGEAGAVAPGNGAAASPNDAPGVESAYPFRGQGIRIPTFDEVLAATDRRPVVAEIKSARAGAALGNWLLERPERERILVGGFSRRDVEPAGRQARWRCAYTDELRSYVLLGKLGLAGWARPAVDAAMVPERRGLLRVVTRRFIRRAHRDGLGVFVWTVDRPEDVRRLLAWGVEGLVTNYPARVRRIVDERHANPELW